jgi:ABC-type polysaccharide/polyol phosphate export permease
VKKTGRDKPIGVIHMCMEATQGISLYSYLYLKLTKRPYFLIIFYIVLGLFVFFFFTKSENRSTEQFLREGGA